MLCNALWHHAVCFVHIMCTHTRTAASTAVRYVSILQLQKTKLLKPHVKLLPVA
jgi:hypothetical protein